MKPIEELGISLTPWDCALTGTAAWVEEAHGLSVAEMSTCELPDLDQAHANARLIAAAPELYEALREAVVETCHNCPSSADDGDKCKGLNPCFVKEWRAALDKAGGEK